MGTRAMPKNLDGRSGMRVKTRPERDFGADTNYGASVACSAKPPGTPS